MGLLCIPALRKLPLPAPAAWGPAGQGVTQDCGTSEILASGQDNKGERKSPKTGLKHQDFLRFHVCVLLQFQPCCFPKEIAGM